MRIRFLVLTGLVAVLAGFGCSSKPATDQPEQGVAVAPVSPEIASMKDAWEKGVSGNGELDLGVGVNLVNAYKNSGDLKAAREVMDEIVKIQPVSSYVLLNMGDLLVAQKDPQGAQSYYEQCLTVARKEKSNDAVAPAYYGLGEVSLLKGDKTAAISFFRKALSSSGGTNEYISNRIAQIES